MEQRQEKACRSKVTVKVNKKEITKFFEDYEKGKAFRDFLIYYVRPSKIKVQEMSYADCPNYEHDSSYKVAKQFMKEEGLNEVKFDYSDEGIHKVKVKRNLCTMRV